MDTGDFLKRRMMDSPVQSQKEVKEKVFELRETVYDHNSNESKKVKSDNMIKTKKEKNIFKTANDRIENDPEHVIEFGKLDKLKSERDLEEATKTFVSLKDPIPENEKSYKLIQNKNGRVLCISNY